jgi:GMP synthase-like glutamine amidotransferase
MSGIFYRGGDIWTMFKVIAGNIPSVEQLQEQDVVILTGSSLSVLDLNPKVEEFSSNLKKALQINKKIKVLGFCFGHQLISHLYGGILRKKKSVLGEEKIDLISENISKINVLHNFQHHRHLTLF